MPVCSSLYGSLQTKALPPPPCHPVRRSYTSFPPSCSRALSALPGPPPKRPPPPPLTPFHRKSLRFSSRSSDRGFCFPAPLSGLSSFRRRSFRRFFSELLRDKGRPSNWKLYKGAPPDDPPHERRIVNRDTKGGLASNLKKNSPLCPSLLPQLELRKARRSGRSRRTRI